jgi:hypothetical protein
MSRDLRQPARHVVPHRQSGCRNTQPGKPVRLELDHLIVDLIPGRPVEALADLAPIGREHPDTSLPAAVLALADVALAVATGVRGRVHPTV